MKFMKGQRAFLCKIHKREDISSSYMMPIQAFYTKETTLEERYDHVGDYSLGIDVQGELLLH